LPDRYDYAQVILCNYVLCCAVRLNEALSQHRAERIRPQGVAVADLERLAVVVPLRDEAERELPDPVKRTAQSQARERR
jgi:hypothetical protein